MSKIRLIGNMLDLISVLLKEEYYWADLEKLGFYHQFPRLAGSKISSGTE